MANSASPVVVGAHAAPSRPARRGRDRARGSSAPITARGVADVRCVAGVDAAAGITAARIFHSGKTRARQTAEAWAEVLGAPLEVAEGLAPRDDPSGLGPTTHLDAATRGRILGAFARLDPHPDASSALERVRAAGLAAAALTNGSVTLTQGLLERAGFEGARGPGGQHR